MKLVSLSLAIALALICPRLNAATFNYHGSLQDAGKPADGNYDLELTLYSAPEGGKVTGGPLTMYKVPVHAGSFSTEADFGPLTHVADSSWLGVRVRDAGNGDFAALTARAPVNASVTQASSCPGSWTLDGNAGNPIGSFMGTTDAKDLVLKSDGHIVFDAPAANTSAVGLSASGVIGAGAYSTAVSNAYAAVGSFSFAGGYSGSTAFAGSFVWGDHPTVAHKAVDDGPNEFIVQAAGGVAFNGVPGDATLTLHPPVGDVSESVNLILDNDGFGQWLVGVDNTDILYMFDNTTSTIAFQFDKTGNLSMTGGLTIGGNAYKPGGGSWLNSSDRRIKNDIHPIANAVETLMKLRPVSYRYNDDYRATEKSVSDKTFRGFIAQEYREVFPEDVVETAQHIPQNGTDKSPILALDTSPAVITAIAAVQELAVLSHDHDEDIASLRTENARLRAELDNVLNRLNRIETKKGE